MVLTRALKVSGVLYVLGLIAFFFAQGLEPAIWFGVGGGLALLNFMVACAVVGKGLSNIRRRGFMLGVLLIKSMSFVALVAFVLMFTKPQVFPFTLGIGIVIFGLTVWAVIESRHSIKKVLNS